MGSKEQESALTRHVGDSIHQLHSRTLHTHTHTHTHNQRDRETVKVTLVHCNASVRTLFTYHGQFEAAPFLIRERGQFRQTQLPVLRASTLQHTQHQFLYVMYSFYMYSFYMYSFYMYSFYMYGLYMYGLYMYGLYMYGLYTLSTTHIHTMSCIHCM